MPHSPLSRYQQQIEYCEISADPGQKAVIDALQTLYETLSQRQENTPRTSLWSRLFQGSSANTNAGGGVYLWGGVGRGKSMLMDMFFHSLTHERKRRVHFHGFMLEVHENIHQYRNQGNADPLIEVARDIAKRYDILCFDELQVHDITDAMILARLFKHLFAQQLTIVFTSNRPPEDLYKNGLQRERFVPFITLIHQHMNIMEIQSEKDYRQGRIASVKDTYLSPDTETNRTILAHEFEQMIAHDLPKPQEIIVQGRQLHIPKSCREVAWFHFEDLCDQPLGTNDYLELAKLFRTFFIIGIPTMNPEMRNQAKRFVHLIDVLYEAHALLFCTAASEPESLYQSGDGSFEFERTASRLREMMAEDYKSHCLEGSNLAQSVESIVR